MLARFVALSYYAVQGAAANAEWSHVLVFSTYINKFVIMYAKQARFEPPTAALLLVPIPLVN